MKITLKVYFKPPSVRILKPHLEYYLVFVCHVGKDMVEDTSDAAVFWWIEPILSDFEQGSVDTFCF